jgi:hypothetical protein
MLSGVPPVRTVPVPAIFAGVGAAAAGVVLRKRLLLIMPAAASAARAMR